MRTLFMAIALLFISIIHAQETENYSIKIANTYLEKLQLNEETKTRFVEIIVNNGVVLYDNSISNREFNKSLKVRQLELSEILTSDEFEKFSILSKEIEPEIKYRF